MDVLVTGAAGFIGSHLVERLLADGHRVLGVDAMTDYYDPQLKRDNLARSLGHDNFAFFSADLATAPLASLVRGVEVVFHLAGEPGVRPSWADGFARYSTNNVLATQRLLEAATGSGVERVVFSSSSSIYGDEVQFPTPESAVPMPCSPYGVTKLAAEHLCRAYAATKGIAAVALRYFTVYGPRQRPDMGLHRFLEHALRDEPIPLFGTGEQIRDFTYVDDVVEATVAAATADVEPGAVCNVAGGSSISINALLDLIGDVQGRPVRIERLPAQAGDVAMTRASTERLRASMGWQPQVNLADGVARQLAWHTERLRHARRGR